MMNTHLIRFLCIFYVFSCIFLHGKDLFFKGRSNELSNSISIFENNKYLFSIDNADTFLLDNTKKYFLVKKYVPKKIDKFFKNIGFYGIIKKNGKFLIEPLYSGILYKNFSVIGEVFALIKAKNLNNSIDNLKTIESILVDKNNKLILGPLKGRIIYCSETNFTLVTENKIKVLNYRGDIIFQTNVKKIQPLNLLTTKDSFFTFLKEGKIGVFSCEKSKVISFSKNKTSSKMIWYSRGVFRVYKNNLVGIVDQYQKEIVPIKFENIYQKKERGAFFFSGTLKKQKYIFSKKGELLFKVPKNYSVYRYINEKILLLRKNYSSLKPWNFGVLSNKGWFIEPKYEYISIYEKNNNFKFLLTSKENGEYSSKIFNDERNAIFGPVKNARFITMNEKGVISVFDEKYNDKSPYELVFKGEIGLLDYNKRWIYKRRDIRIVYDTINIYNHKKLFFHDYNSWNLLDLNNNKILLSNLYDVGKFCKPDIFFWGLHLLERF